MGGYYVIDLKEGHSMRDRIEECLGGKVIRTSSLVLRNERVIGSQLGLLIGADAMLMRSGIWVEEDWGRSRDV